MQESDLRVGDCVGYKDINLPQFKGRLTEIRQLPNGGDCKVKWEQPNRIETSDCLNNLRKIEG
jgi:hypothetical protein